MEANVPTTDGSPWLFIEGIDQVIRRDLEKHQAILARTYIEKQAYQQAASHEIQKKKFYRKQIGGGKYDDKALRRSMKDIAVNIRHMQDKVKLSEDKIEHETLIVDTLSEQLKQYEIAANAVADRPAQQADLNH